MASRVWLATENRTITFGQLRDRIERVAALLSQLGVAPGERVVVATRDDAEAALLFVGLICSGVTAVNIDPETGARRAASLIAKAAPRLVLADRDVAARWEIEPEAFRLLEIVGESKRSLLGGMRKSARTGLHGMLDTQTPTAPMRHIDGETLAYIMFTSGTTDQPKGVCISHRALFAHLATLRRRYGYRPDSRILNTLMLAHADGMIQGPVMGFAAGIPVYRPVRFEISSIERLLDAIYQLRITHLVAVPTMLSLIQRLGVSQRDAFQGGDFKLLISCGAQLEAALCESFETTFRVPIVNVYGLTETVVGGVFAGPDARSRLPGGIGLPEDCDLRIVDLDGVAVTPGQPGELQMRGDLLMSGYFEAPELTAEVFADGWLRTGDVATQDSAGRFRITGRMKNIVIRGGYNIHPEEITEVLQRHPAVSEAVTFGIADDVWGETVASLVVASDSVSNEELIRHCSHNLEPRKVPTRIERAPALPRGLSGKVVLERARQMLHTGAAGACAAAGVGTATNGTGTHETVSGARVSGATRGAPAAVAPGQFGDSLGSHVERLLQLASSCFKTERSALSLASIPRDVPGWDSLAHLEFVCALEKEFSVRLTAREIMSLDRLDKALELVSRA
jgi:long-chain acyl-CoA synthetase